VEQPSESAEEIEVKNSEEKQSSEIRSIKPESEESVKIK